MKCFWERPSAKGKICWRFSNLSPENTKIFIRCMVLMREAAATLAVWEEVSLQMGTNPQTQCLGFKDKSWTHYLYTAVHSVPWFQHQNGAATRFGALRDVWVAVGPYWQCLLWQQTCSAPWQPISAESNQSKIAWVQKLYQDLGNRMELSLYWAKAEWKGTSRCRSQRAARVPPAKGSLIDFSLLSLLLCSS